ncbi:MAG: lysophospholipid acyltransferase family protein [Myxococcales bacterium]|nr:lysophospholipid acyltransferase family protein [Myxococcales bacterium]
MRWLIGRLWLRIFGWTLVGTLPDAPKWVFIAAPHTSNWDLPFMLATAWSLRVRVSWLGKHTLFEGPFAPFMRWLGGLPVDRRAPHGLVAQVVGEFARRERLVLAIPPEGTRSYRDFWKSGFYHIAVGADVPVGTGFLDFAQKRCGLGPTLRLTGDVRADMDRVRAFYEPLRGKVPADQGPVRLREEGEASP